MANDTEIGSISIGISADTSQLKSAFAEAKRQAAEFKIPEREIAIRVRIATPTEASIATAQRKIAETLKKAQSLEIPISPTITVAQGKINDFRNTVAAAMDKTKAIPVTITASVDETAMRNQIKAAIGVINVPLRWYWENGSPPAGGTPGPGTPPGSPGPRPGSPNPPPPGSTATGRGTGVVYTRPSVTTQQRGGAVTKCPFCSTVMADPGRLPTHIAEKHPAQSAPATPAAGQAAGAPASPFTPGAGGAPVMTTTAAPATEAEMRRNRFAFIRNQLSRGRPQGMSELIKAGARVNVSGGAAITAKKGSDLAKFLKESVDPESALGFLEDAIESYAKAVEKETKAPSDFSGSALSMAGATPVRSADATNQLRAEIEKMAKDRAKEYANRPDVQELKAAFQTQGFSALGPGLEAARQMISQDPARAREMTVELLSQFFNVAPKAAKKLFTQDPGKGKTGGAGPRTKLPRKLATKTDEIAPGEEVTGAAISALFSELFRVSLPIRDARAKLERQEQIAVRKGPRKKLVEGQLIPVVETPMPAYGPGEEREYTATAAQSKALAKRKATVTARPMVDRAGNPILPKEIDPYKLRIRQTEAQIMEEERAGRASRNYRIDTLGNRVPGRAGGGGVGGKRAYIVGEKGPEVFVPREDGEIIPNDRMEHRAAGGTIQYRGGGASGRAHYISGGLAAGLATASGLASSLSNAVSRVFVVNWPSHGGFGAAASAPGMGAAAGPFTSTNMGQMGQAMGQALGRAQASTSKTPRTPRSAGQVLSPLEEAQLEIERQAGVTTERLRLRGTAAETAAAVREAPTRGVPTATGEISALRFGGLSGVIERRRAAEEAQTRAGVALGSYTKAQDKLRETEEKLAKAQTPEQVKEYTKSIQDQIPAVQLLRNNYEQLRDNSEAMSESVISGSNKMKIFAANTTGVVGGMIIFSTLLGAAQAAITGIGEVIGPIVERFSGWANVSAKVTDNLAEQTRQSGGAIQTTLALSAAQAGLSDATFEAVSAAIEQRVQGQAGNKAFQAQLELLHSAQSLQRQGGVAGFDRSLVETTGGLNVAGVQTPIGGTPSFFEQLNNELRQFSATTGAAAVNPMDEALKGAINSTPVFGDINRGLNMLGGGLGPAQPNNPQARAADQAFVLNTMRDVGDAAKRAGGELNFVAAGSADLKQQQAQQVDQLRQSNIPAFRDLATTLEMGNIVIPKTFASLQELQTYLLEGAKAAQTGATMPDPAVLMKTMTERLIPNQLAAFGEEARQQLETFIPAQRGLQSLAEPQLPFGTGLTQQTGGFGAAPTTGFGQGTLDPMAKQSFKEYETVATSALDAVAAKAREGKVALAGLGVPPELIGEMETLGKQAQSIEIGVANRSAAFEAAQYNRQLFIMKRNLADAEALLGRQVGSQGRLGQLERENFELGKKQQALQIQAQTLSLELTQRQINFQRAVAGFQAPGLTPEERRANVAQAKIEADFAQRQLNIQKQLLGLGKRQFAVSVDIFGESARRQVQDLKSALQELQAGRALQLDTRAANEALKAIRAREAQIAQDIGVYIDKAQKKAAAAIGAALDIANKTGAAFGDILVQTGKAWGIFVGQASAAITQITNPNRGISPGGRGGAGGKAGGFLGQVSGATSMIVGEAGTETVAVLRNPRMSNISGGGGGSVVINFNGDFHVRSDSDIDVLVQKVVSAMGRQASLKGLRTVG